MAAHKRITGLAYQSLRDALSVIYWRKAPFRRYLTVTLASNPELLVGIDFDGMTKREAVDVLIERLSAKEYRYQDQTLRLMLEVSEMTRFTDLEQQADRPELIGNAEEAVADLRQKVSAFRDLAAERERIANDINAARSKAQKQRTFADDIADLKARFLELSSKLGDEPQRRGIEFEKFLNALFAAFDLQPRLSYRLPTEQVDGAFTFDTDDYVMEAKWTKKKFSRSQADSFVTVVRRRGKNALGLVVSIAGFSPEMLQAFSESTAFLTIDGLDLFAVLEQRISLTDMLAAKKRHANETGSCYHPVREFT